MSTYSIKTLEGLTNLKAHTIRTWELRYNLLKPHRTDTNIRYYDDEHLKKLLNVCVLINSGIKISKVSKLTDEQILLEIVRLMDGAFGNDLQEEAIAHQALIAITAYDEPLFEKIFSNALLRFGLVKTYMKVVYPLMIKTGLMWSRSDLMPAQEHFMSNLIKQKLFASIDALPLPGNSSQTWVLFLNEREEHEIGLLFASYILRQQGKKVIYLGGNVPYDNLASVIAVCNPTHLYSFLTKNLPVSELNKLFSNLCKDFPHVKLCVSGRLEVVDQAMQNHDNLCWINDIEKLIAVSN
ncbi:MAG: MerR family transcriptional regulator [Bacteroidetes bacterium]|nr:MerR family transcriptional regulator [Bacteroidota bacterium]